MRCDTQNGLCYWSDSSVRGSAVMHSRVKVTAMLIAAVLSAWASTARPAPFTEADLQVLLRSNAATGKPVDSIDELLPLLPSELRSNFTLVYDSRSPFRSSISHRHPRVILFSDDARLVLTFTGDPDKPGADVLETLAFDDATARFALRAYLLPAGERRGFRPPAEAMNCAGCHGDDPRPIFNSYPVWPGFYGSVLDTFPPDRLGVAELESYKAFLRTTATTGIYRHLLFPAGSSTSPYLDPHHLRNDTVELNEAAFPYVPNARLGMALTELNRKRIYRKLSQGPRFRVNERRILAELLGCPGSSRPSPAALHSMQEQVERENLARLERLGVRSADPRQEIRNMQELHFVRALAEIDDAARLAGADRSDWSMALESGSLAFFDGILSGIHAGKSYYLKEDWITEILDQLAFREPAFRRYFASDSVFADLGYPFGHRLDIGRALKGCKLLGTSPLPTGEGGRRVAR